MPLEAAQELFREVHEERLQYLERSMSECTAAVAVAGVETRALKDETRDLKSETKAGFLNLAKLLEPIPDLSNRVKVLESYRDRRQARIATLKKAAWALVLAVIGAALKGAVDVFAR